MCGRGLKLQQIRTQTLKPLHLLIRQIHVRGRVEHYEELFPSIGLYLSNNELDDLPGELFKLENLKVLSLRSNNLTEISSSVGKLTKLEELNVACNQLNWLPWEFLQTKACHDMWKLLPNPFIRPTPITEEYNKRVSMPGSDHAHHVASTHIAFLDVTGASNRQWRPAPSSTTEHWPDLARIHDFLGPRAEEQTRVHSLLELVLRKCYNSPQLSRLPLLLPEDVGGAYLIELLKQTFYIKEAGGRECSVCGREYIVPRTEWVEWWYLVSPRSSGAIQGALARSGGPTPFLRRGCSWACWVQAPDTVITGWSLAPTEGRLPGGDATRVRNVSI